MPRICIVPAVEGIGGMATFRNKFEAGLKTRGVDVTHDPEDSAEAILVIAGTRNLIPLWRARRRGVRIVQRLDGINWIQRRRFTGIRHFIRAEYGNLLLSLIRSRIATHILYQSEFSHRWWDDWYGKPDKPYAVVHNGVDLDLYQPNGVGGLSIGRYRLLVVEGSLGGGYDMGLDNAVQLAETLAKQHNFMMELMVVGKITDEHKASVEARSHIPITWAGSVPREKIPEIDRSAHLLFSADLNAACPNSVIEAMACGLPVVAFDTGALNELVIGDAGRLVPYGGDPWKLELPDIPALAEAAAEILCNRPRFRTGARAQAEAALGLDKMVDGYLKVLLEA
ncbi:MAG: glycosyltransferase family 4 protein [Chloroflexi bacterium]|nr:glycosyltransferase family 4 protein [Chloroflexota bacterium]